MDSKILENRLSVLLRVLGDESMSQYECCIEVLGKTAVKIHDNACPPGTAFMRKDRLEHSPQACNYASTAGPFEPASPANRRQVTGFSSAKRSKSTPTMQKREFTFDFDYIFTTKDTVDSITSHVINDFSLSQCLVSLGKSDTINEVVPVYLAKAYREGWRVKLQVSTVAGKKLTQFFGNEEAEFLTLDSALEAIRASEGLNRRKIGDSIAVVTMRLETDGVSSTIQVVDIPVLSKSAELLCSVLSNSDKPQDALAIESDKLMKLMKKSLTANAVVKVLGNVYPTGPHFQAAKEVLKILDQLMLRRHRCETLQTKILSDQVFRLKRAFQKAQDDWEQERHKNDEMRLRYLEQIKRLEGERAQFSSQIEDCQRQMRENTKEAFFREALMLKDAEILDLKERLRSAKGTQPNDFLEKQLAIKDNRIQELEYQLQLERSNSTKASMVPNAKPRKLSCTKSFGALCLNGSKSDRDFIAELLKDSWRYTDAMMEQFQQSIAQAKLLSESKVARLNSKLVRCENEFKIYRRLYYELSKEIDTLANSRNAQDKELESLREMHSKREEKVRTDFRTLKDNAKAKISEKKGLIKTLTQENASLRAQISDSEALRAQINELVAQCESWQFTASRNKEECEAALKENKRLEEQVVQLRELRKPLRPR
mmetsp:Transcript_7747/g.14700  ORF Transcript_7747/g.14700 Transcript_7747/m.14700 type:complete len:656 (+) Transcript_7747:1251-3218(+)